MHNKVYSPPVKKLEGLLLQNGRGIASKIFGKAGEKLFQKGTKFVYFKYK